MTSSRADRDGTSLGLARAFLRRAGLQAPGEPSTWTPLTGGVSADLWRVDLPGRTLCVKRALPTLRVAAEWHAPIERNTAEYRWLSMAAQHAPTAVPRLLGHDPEAGLFAMEYLPPETHPVWKAELMAGLVDIWFAAAVGDLLGRLHAVSRHDPDIPATYANGANFAALRLDPYLRATARHHPGLTTVLSDLANRTSSIHRALVHGDVSPKNILHGPVGPVLLDAECACFGDPAFDHARAHRWVITRRVPDQRWRPHGGPGLRHRTPDPARVVDDRRPGSVAANRTSPALRCPGPGGPNRSLRGGT